jgi:hypothetical protein
MLLLLGLLAVADPSATGLVRIAVTDVSHDDDLEPRVARVFAESLAQELRKLERVSVISMEEVRAMLAVEANRQAVGCDSDKSCLAEIADALGADAVLIGAVATVDGARVLSLKRLDQRSAAVVGVFDERLTKAGGEELLAAVGPAVEKLFPELPLRAGQTRGVAEEKARLLHPPPVPVWATAGAGVVVVLTGAAAVSSGVAASLEASSTQALLDRSSDTRTVDGLALQDAQARIDQLALTSNVLTGVAVVAAIATGVVVPFTDWTNAAAAAAAE